MRSLWLVILLNACGSVNANVPDGGADDVDASDPPVGANPCLGGGFVQLCLTELPRDPLVIEASKQIDTDKDSRCTSFSPANPAWCVISATRISIAAGATLSAVGNRPLVLAATEALQIDGTIDVASHLVGNQHTRGAGAMPSDCAGSVGASYPGGGAGGSFRSRGGAGGSVPGMAGGGVASAAAVVTKLRGGCSGGNGGVADPNPGGEGGAGGGAVYLLAPSITVAGTGVINASGSGGTTAPFDSSTGAGGGGSGGMIGLDAPAIHLAAGARLFANGGGGGEGSGCPIAGQNTDGANGQDPRSPTVPALGGRQEPNGGDGGDGALSTTDGARGADGVGGCSFGVAGGGGGGGGGGGAIVFHGAVTDAGAQISPPVAAMP
jgi:hypothetical protein